MNKKKKVIPQFPNNKNQDWSIKFFLLFLNFPFDKLLSLFPSKKSDKNYLCFC